MDQQRPNSRRIPRGHLAALCWECLHFPGTWSETQQIAVSAAALVQGAGMFARASLSRFPVDRNGLRVLANGALYRAIE